MSLTSLHLYYNICPVHTLKAEIWVETFAMLWIECLCLSWRIPIPVEICVCERELSAVLKLLPISASRQNDGLFSKSIKQSKKGRIAKFRDMFELHRQTASWIRGEPNVTLYIRITSFAPWFPSSPSPAGIFLGWRPLPSLQGPELNLARGRRQIDVRAAAIWRVNTPPPRSHTGSRRPALSINCISSRPNAQFPFLTSQPAVSPRRKLNLPSIAFWDITLLVHRPSFRFWFFWHGSEMSSSGDVCFCHPLLRGSTVARLSLRGQAVPERVGCGDPGRAVRGGGDRQGARLRTGPTGRCQRPPWRKVCGDG